MLQAVSFDDTWFLPLITSEFYPELFAFLAIVK